MKKKAYHLNEFTEEMEINRSESFLHEFKAHVEESTDMFTDDINRIKSLIQSGRISPIHKQLLDEWREIHPIDFERFCNEIGDKERKKLFNFMNITHGNT
jgi:hypothetical protein